MGALEERDWRRLVEKIGRGNCILVLGSDVAFDPDDPEQTPLTLRLAHYLADHLNENLPRPPQPLLDLPFITQMYLQQPDRDRIDLEIDIQDFYKPYLEQSTDFHKALASLPFTLCLTTTPDRFMVNAFQAAGKSPTAAHYHLNRPGQMESLTAPDVEHPIVYSLFGDLDNPSSLVLSETEMLDFLVEVLSAGSKFPDYIAGQLADPKTSYLFLGFGFQHWYARILLRVLQLQSHRGRSSLALEGDAFFAHPERARTVLFFGSTHSIVFRRHAWKDFAAELCGRFEKTEPSLPHGSIAPPPGASRAPQIFLCYDSRDEEAVRRLQACLHELGVDTWRDKNNLRGGDNWDRQIRNVLWKQVDYVLVCETPHMLSRGESYLHLEIKEALERQKRFPEGQLFLIPGLVKPSDKPSHLEHLHRIDLTTEEGIKDFARCLLEDWQQRVEEENQNLSLTRSPYERREGSGLR